LQLIFFGFQSLNDRHLLIKFLGQLRKAITYLFKQCTLDS
jgi:hypothetical protein